MFVHRRPPPLPVGQKWNATCLWLIAAGIGACILAALPAAAARSTASTDDSRSLAAEGGSGIYWFDVSDSPTAPRLLSSSEGKNAFPAISPDGRLVAFISDREGFDAVYVMRLDGSGLRRVSEPLPSSPVVIRYLLSQPRWASMKEIVFSSATVRYSQDKWSDSAIWRVAAAGGRPEQLVAAGVWEQPWELSRDRRYLSLLRGQGFATPGCDLFVVPLDGSGPVRVAQIARCPGRVPPAWSPRANLIAFATGDRVVVADTHGRRRISIAATGPSSPAWSPDGRRVAYLVGGRRPGISISTLATGQIRRVVDLPLQLGRLGWSPRGDWLIVQGSDGDQVVVVRPTGLDLHALSTSCGECLAQRPQWSADGRQVAFLGDEIELEVTRPLANTDQLPEDAPSRLASGAGCGTQTDPSLCGFTWTGDSRHILAGSPTLPTAPNRVEQALSSGRAPGEPAADHVATHRAAPSSRPGAAATAIRTSRVIEQTHPTFLADLEKG